MSNPSVQRRRWALVDTSAYFATIDAGERNHAAAVAMANRLSTERWRLFTTNFILAETHALFLTRVNRAVAATVLSEIDNSPTTIVRVTACDEAAASLGAGRRTREKARRPNSVPSHGGLEGIRTWIIEADRFVPRPVAVHIPPILPEQRQRFEPSEEMLLELAAGLSLRRIAAEVGVSRETVRQRLDEAGREPR